MRITFLGNCQVRKTFEALRMFNPRVQMEYAGNSRHVGMFDPARTEKLISESDVVISQPIMNEESDLSRERLMKRLGEKLLFMPYIYVDGVFSLCVVGSKKPPNDIINAAACENSLVMHGVDETVRRFKIGKIDFEHKKRFDFNVEEMRKRETYCEFKAIDYIISSPKRSMLTHNHPTPDVIVHIAKQVAQRCDLKFNDAVLSNHSNVATLTLPMFTTVVSPYGLDELGLKWEPDLNWFLNGRELIRKIGIRMNAAT